MPSVFSKTKMPAKWYQLNAMIDKEESTIRSLKNLGPRLKWRLLELETERIKLIKEKENKTFLEVAGKSKVPIKKERFFNQSKSMEKKVRFKGLSLIKKFPRFKYNADIYYTLALNSRDYGGDKYTERFLKLALRSSIPNSPIIHNAKTTLAEHYYNEKKYRKAIRFYDDVLENKDDEWYSKHLLNSSWCHIKTKKYIKAIRLAKEAFIRSKEEDYIDVSPQVLDSIGFFYVLAEKEEEGGQYYIDNEKAPGKYIIKMAKKTADNGKFAKANNLLEMALDNSKSKKNYNEIIEINSAQLDFFRNFKRFDRFYDVSQSIMTLNKKHPIKDDLKYEVVEKIRSFVGYLQIRFTRNNQTKIENHDVDKRRRILSFFDILTQINPKERDNYLFYQGETLYAVSMWTEAFLKYQAAWKQNWVFLNPKKLKKKKKMSQVDQDEAFELLKKRKKFQTKIMDSLLSVLENSNFKKDSKEVFTVFTYENHLKAWPVNERSQVLYKKLFNLYMNNKKIDNAHRVLDTYVKFYPQDLKIQQAMFTQEMDHYIKTKNSDKLSLWLSNLSSGYLKFDKKYINKATIILGQILFESYQKLDKEGKKNQAAKGYLSLLEDPRYPKSIKSKAIFRASILYLDLGKTKTSSKWAIKSMNSFKKKEAMKRIEQYQNMAIKYSELQDFQTAGKLSLFIFKKYCSESYKGKESNFKNSFYWSMAENHIVTADTKLKLAKKCGIKTKTITTLNLEIGKRHFNFRKFSNFIKFFNSNKNETSYQRFFANSFVDFYWDAKLKNHKKNQKTLIKLFSNLLKKKTIKGHKRKEMELILSFNKKIKEVNKLNLKSFSKLKKFNEQKFNGELEGNIKLLKFISAQLEPYIKSGNPHIVLASYKILAGHYKSLSQQVGNFTPLGVPSDYVKGFKQAMNQLSSNIYNEHKTFMNLGKKLIYQNEILSSNNKYFTGTPAVIGKIGHRHPASFYVMPMDKLKKEGLK